MRLDDGVGDQVPDFGVVALAVLDFVQHIAAPLQGFGMLGVISRNARVQIPAEVIETRGVDQLANVGGRLVLQMLEADDDVGHLDAGVVDVVLHLDVFADGAQHAHEGVAQNRVAQVTDVRGFVGIDVGVLDDYFSVPLRSSVPPGSRAAASDSAEPAP